jgi:hypothetical protein
MESTGNRWVAYASIEDFHDETANRAKNYRRDRQEHQAVYIEFWCEAAGMVPQLQTVAADYSIPGALVRRVRVADRRAPHRESRVRRNVPTVLLHVGDYDPSGESIFDAMTEDAAAFAQSDRVLETSKITGGAGGAHERAGRRAQAAVGVSESDRFAVSVVGGRDVPAGGGAARHAR